MKKHTVLIRPIAKADIAEISEWYQQKSVGLGDDFLEAVGHAITNIEENPLAFAVLYKNIRRSLLSKFPYALFYTLDESELEVSIIVLGCFHMRRNPQRWQMRG